MAIILSTKLKNAINKHMPNMEYMLKTISINGNKRGCSGFIRNPQNNAIVYVNTEEPVLSSLHYMYRYADNIKDYTGYHNRWANTLDELAKGIADLLKTPVSETKDCKL